ncbi:MAG: ferrous iron transport protein A [Firmicutes bacterium]|nr:ferrous iron transport protein A [Bacillota bacterium]
MLDEGIISRSKRIISLSELPLGQSAVVVRLPQDQALLARLAAYGLLPGVELQVERQTPAPVILCGATRVALDRKTARAIMVLF